ncbi:MAG TPA: PilZ domain-containing protein [Myxococcales bacterium]|nr:PilZ domain-containing protein [Myxococcales bacterium]HIK85012.1 PilZ domain-containing protein [Myxococcales bacterium]
MNPASQLQKSEALKRETTYAATRAEPREQTVHVVEYSRYPRRLANEGRHVAYTQDRSEGGLGLDLAERVWPGELLQITLRDIDGRVSIDGLARVVWCRETKEGRAEAGISMLRESGERPMMRVRRRNTALRR